MNLPPDDLDARRELLEATHDFPCNYTLKAFGSADEEFILGVRAAAATVHSGATLPVHTVKTSGKGNHVSVSITVFLQGADDVFSLYTAVREVPGLKMLL